MTDNEENEEKEHQFWLQVENKTLGAVKAYMAMVASCNDLAELIGYQPDFILRNLLPKSAESRATGQDLVAKIASLKEEIMMDWKELEADRYAIAKRAELISRLGLTEDQVKLISSFEE